MMPQDMLPKVSVVCSWYNRADAIPDTVGSLLAQDYGNLEIVIVNDGSPDPGVRAMFDRYDDPRLRIIHQPNTGLVRAMRRAIAETDGAFIAIMGAGDICAPHRISLQARFLAENPDYALVGCGFRSAWVPPRDPDAPFHNWDLGEGAAAPRAGTLVRSPTMDELSERNAFSHGEVMMRRTCYDAVSGYRVFFQNAQDIDLWLRLAERYRLGVLGEFMYERRIFMSDGIAADLRKNMVQIAFARMATFCGRERRKGGRDSVDRYGPAAMMRVPRDVATLKQVLRAVKQVKGLGVLDLREMGAVRDLYGPFFHLAARLYGGYLQVRYGDAPPPKRQG
jgi:glycosyltransferase involved in cell wall biosynthesis